MFSLNEKRKYVLSLRDALKALWSDKLFYDMLSIIEPSIHLPRLIATSTYSL